MTLTFESVDEILWCDHSNESSLPVLSHGAICFSKCYKMKLANLVDIFLWLHLAVKGLNTNFVKKRKRKAIYHDHYSLLSSNNRCRFSRSFMHGHRKSYDIKFVIVECACTVKNNSIRRSHTVKCISRTIGFWHNWCIGFGSWNSLNCSSAKRSNFQPCRPFELNSWVWPKSERFDLKVYSNNPNLEIESVRVSA